MIEVTDRHLYYRIPEFLAFAFNPQQIYIAAKTEEFTNSVFTISGGGKTFTDSREAIHSVVKFDISYYLRLFFNFNTRKIGGETESTSRNVTITVKSYNNMGETVDTYNFTILAIFGAINIGEMFNSDRELTWFKNFPFTFDFFAFDGTSIKQRDDDGVFQQKAILLDTAIHHLFPNSSAQKKVIYRIGNSGMKTFNFTFSDTFNGGTKDLIIELNICECTSGIYLRWLDKNGFYNYYLFDIVTDTLKYDNKGEEISIDYFSNTFYSGKGSFFNGVVEQNKTGFREISLQAPLIDRNTQQMLVSVFTSPIVDMYKKMSEEEDDYIFVPVKVSAGSHAIGKQHLQDFDLTIILPETITQEL